MEKYEQVNVEKIMDDIRREVARRKLIPDHPSADDQASVRHFRNQNEDLLIPRGETRLLRMTRRVRDRLGKHAPKLVSAVTPMAKRFVKNNRRAYSIGEFQRYHDSDFIANAYRVILKREPDPTGRDQYLAALRNGEHRSVILAKLRYSEEGRRKNVAIRGLMVRLFVDRLFRLPILGYLFQIGFSIVRLPRILAYIRKCEAVTNSRFEDLGKTSDALSTKIETRTSQLQDMLVKKADKNLLSELSYRLTTKVGTDALEEIRGALAAKASMAAVESVDRTATEDVAELRKALDESLRQIRDHKLNILELQRRMSLLLEEARKRFPEPISRTQLENMLSEEDHAFDAMYVAFEDQFRGTRADIKERLKVYLPLIQKRIPDSQSGMILDVGSGRGEWLELLRENNYNAKGVDQNRVMVQQCIERGLEVMEYEAIAYMRNQKSDSFDVVTGFHVVEHLSLKVLLDLFDECLRVLKPGGMVIFETPNPENLIVAGCNFYFDPTHTRPIPPPPLTFLAEQRGFVRPEILRLHPYKLSVVSPDGQEYSEQITSFFSGAQDYSLIAYKCTV